MLIFHIYEFLLLVNNVKKIKIFLNIIKFKNICGKLKLKLIIYTNFK
jgi:hypothetical protein